MLLDFQVEISTVEYSFDSLSKNSTVHTYALISHSVTTTALKISLGESLASGQYHSEGVVFLGFFLSNYDNARFTLYTLPPGNSTFLYVILLAKQTTTYKTHRKVSSKDQTSKLGFRSFFFSTLATKERKTYTSYLSIVILHEGVRLR